MNTASATPNWAAARGEKWRANAAGLEATLSAVDEPLIQALNLDAPCRIADVACGGGGTTLQVLRRAPAGSIVHGFDISPALIEFARARISHAAEPGPRPRTGGEGGRRAGEGTQSNSASAPLLAFEVADLETAPPPQVPYDRLLSRFGTMFFKDPSGAFASLFHWLNPGGRFAFAVWAASEENPWTAAVSEAVGRIITIPPVDPEAPGPTRYADAAKLLRLLEQAGFCDLAVQDWRGELPIGGGLPASEAANFALASFSSLSELLAEAGDQALQQARQSVTDLFSRHEKAGIVCMAACVHIVTGHRPPSVLPC